jgi:hypothetical protein
VVRRRIGDVQLQTVSFDPSDFAAVGLRELSGDDPVIVDYARQETVGNRDAAQRDGARIVQVDLQMDAGKVLTVTLAISSDKQHFCHFVG